MLLRSKLAPKLKKEDVAQVNQVFKEFAIVRIKEESKLKFSGTGCSEHVAKKYE